MVDWLLLTKIFPVLVRAIVQTKEHLQAPLSIFPLRDKFAGDSLPSLQDQVVQAACRKLPWSRMKPSQLYVICRCVRSCRRQTNWLCKGVDISDRPMVSIAEQEAFSTCSESQCQLDARRTAL
jgi:hypothetical protein